MALWWYCVRYGGRLWTLQKEIEQFEVFQNVCLCRYVLFRWTCVLVYVASRAHDVRSIFRHCEVHDSTVSHESQSSESPTTLYHVSASAPGHLVPSSTGLVAQLSIHEVDFWRVRPLCGAISYKTQTDGIFKFRYECCWSTASIH